MKSAALLLFLVGTAFAQTSFAQFNNDALRAQAACGPVAAQFQVRTSASEAIEPAVDAAKALVYVVEDEKFKFAKDITVRVGADGAWVGATRGSSYL